MVSQPVENPFQAPQTIDHGRATWRQALTVLREVMLWAAALTVAVVVRWVMGRLTILVWLVAYAATVRMLLTHARTMPVGGTRRHMQHRRLWRITLLSLPIVACLNLLTYWDTFRAYATDGIEGVGWPFLFLGHGGIAYRVYWDPVAAAADLAVCGGIAVATGWALRDGGRLVRTTAARFLRGQPQRTWREREPYGPDD